MRPSLGYSTLYWSNLDRKRAEKKLKKQFGIDSNAESSISNVEEESDKDQSPSVEPDIRNEILTEDTAKEVVEDLTMENPSIDSIEPKSVGSEGVISLEKEKSSKVDDVKRPLYIGKKG